MILRDSLALDRTVLANKRTFLAYGHTSIALLALGSAFVKLIDHRGIELAGFFLTGFGIRAFFVGLTEFLRNTARFKRPVAKEKEYEQEVHETSRSTHKPTAIQARRGTG